MNMKKITILSVLAVAIIVGGFLFFKFKNNPISNNPSPAPSSQQEAENLQTFTDEEYGISFQYPQQFSVNAGIDFNGRYAIHLFSKDRMNAPNPLERNLDLLGLTFPKDKLEDLIKSYRENKMLDNLIIDDISIGNLHGKKVSFTEPIGDATVGVLLPWRGGLLLRISYFPPYDQETKDVYQKIIASIKQIN